MATVLLTETGDKLIAEGGIGITGASSLNDSTTQTIYKEDFATDPISRGWLMGLGWIYDAVDKRLEFTP